MDKEANVKLQKDPVSRGVTEPIYPYMSGEAKVFSHKIEYEHPQQQEKSFTEQVNHDASFEIVEYRDREDSRGIKSELDHSVRNYALNSSEHRDGNADRKSYHVSNVTDKQTGLAQAGGGVVMGTADMYVQLARNGTFNAGGTEASANPEFNYVSGNRNSVFEKNVFNYYEEDHADHVSGSKYTVLKEGEYGIHVQEGNMDTRVEQGKLQIYSGDAMSINTNSTMVVNAASNMTINSQTKITIKVGGSSIVIEPSKITITSAEVNIVKG